MRAVSPGCVVYSGTHINVHADVLGEYRVW